MEIASNVLFILTVLSASAVAERLVDTTAPPASAASESPVCKDEVVVDEKLRDQAFEARKSWSPALFSAVDKFDESAFRLLVHASSSPEFYDHLMTQKPLAGRPVESFSLLDQNHTNTYGNLGVIVALPAANVFATHHDDMFSYELKDARQKKLELNNHSGRLSAAYQKFGIQSPDTLLQKTKAEPSSHYADQNEILATGCTKAGGEIKIVGLFVKTDSLGNILAPKELYQRAIKAAKAGNLKIIKIGPPREFPAVQVIETSNTLNEDDIRVRTLQVQATEKEFLELQKKAEASGRRLLAIQGEDTYYTGAFRGREFFLDAGPNTAPEKMRNNPLLKYVVIFGRSGK